MTKTAPQSVLVVTGATFEADIAAGDGVTVICSGAMSSRLRQHLDDIGARTFSVVISFGLAGGLDPALRPGDLVIADEIVSGAKTWRANPVLADRLQSALDANRKISRCRFAGADAAVMDPASKSALRAATGAGAVDMETHMAAEFAEQANLPWAALRAVCDPAHRALPPLARQALGPDGGIELAGVLKSLAREPSQIPALLRTGIDTAFAIAALRRARRLLGGLARLGGADFR